MSKPPKAMRPRNQTELKKKFNLEGQNEIFFTMKVYAVQKGGKLEKLKYSIDLHPPFEANDTATVEPYASPLVGKNTEAFGRIFHNVKEVLRFIASPDDYKYQPYNSKDKYEYSPNGAAFRKEEQDKLAKAIKLAEGAINHVTYESYSPAALSVGAVFRATGNGDMKPPPK